MNLYIFCGSFVNDHNESLLINDKPIEQIDKFIDKKLNNKKQLRNNANNANIIAPNKVPLNDIIAISQSPKISNKITLARSSPVQ